VRIGAGEDGTVTLRAVRSGGTSARARGIATVVILATGALLWFAARRLPRGWSFASPRLARWWWLACGAAWISLLEPLLPGLVMLGFGIWTALPRPAVNAGSGPTPAGDDSTLTLASG
jgi:hypothetical protein